MSSDASPNPDPAAKAAQAWASSLNLPDEIGGYRIQRIIGSGGMATVFAALQKQPRRTVALKVMKAGVATDTAFRRFKREIEILGKLHHPFIAQVYDAGVHQSASGESVPYFVMEYISGAKTILEYIAARELNVRDRLKLFVKVCAAVEHGHRNKVIHRDLKPGNILIDQFGEPKVIDFGVAHAAELDVTSQTMHTEAGRLVGTLQYMSPEQVDANLTDLDARCDVYALGVMLYKMLTGKPPHDLEALPVYEAVRIIREETPVAPGEIKPELRGDLETIILKAMEHDRARRYHSAGSLGRDIVRFLADKPINARRASLLHRATLAARRHRTALVVASIVTVVMGIAAAIVLIERHGVRKRQQQDSMTLHETQEALRQARTVPPQASQPATQPELEVFALRQHSGSITQLTFVAPSRLVSASVDRTAVIWDLSTRQPLVTLREFDGPVTHLAATSDGTIVAAATDAGPILLIETGTGKILRTLRPEVGAIGSLAISPRGERIAIACSDLTLRVLSTGLAGPRAYAPLVLRGTTGLFGCVAFGASPDRFAAGSERGVVYAWNVAAPDEPRAERRLRGLQGRIVSVALIAVADDERIFAISEDGNGQVWLGPVDGSTAPASVSNFNVGLKLVVGAWINPVSQELVCVGPEGITRWSVADGRTEPVGELLPWTDPGKVAAIDESGQWLARGHEGGDIVVQQLAAPRSAP